MGHSRIIDLSGFFGSIETDLKRRDFTVNAMAVPLADWHSGDLSGTVIDPFGGRGDLLRKTIRALNPGVFRDDPGRLLRAVRLAGELGLRVEPETVRSLAANSRLLPQVSPDRVCAMSSCACWPPTAPGGAWRPWTSWDCWSTSSPNSWRPRALTSRGCTIGTSGATLCIPLESVEGVTGGHQNSPIYSCVPWTPESEAHFARKASDGHTRRTILKLAALFHDIAKPQTKTLEADGRTRFFGHSEQGAAVTEARLTALRLSSRGVDMVSRMVEHHLRPSGMAQEGQWPSNRAIHRYFRDTGEVAVDTLYLCLADYLGAKGPELAHPQWLNHAKMVAHVLHTGTQAPVAVSTPRLVSGHDLMSRFQLQPGPHIGSLLEVIEEARAAGEIETQEQALKLAANTLNNPTPNNSGPSREESRAASG